jgi:hypothetical protein
MRAKALGVGALAHLVFEHAAVFGEDLLQVRRRELLARVYDNDAVAERHGGPALVRMTRRMQQHSVVLNQLHHLEHVLPRLFERTRRANDAHGREQLDFRFVSRRDRIQPPVFDLEHEQPPSRVHVNKSCRPRGPMGRLCHI